MSAYRDKHVILGEGCLGLHRTRAFVDVGRGCPVRTATATCSPRSAPSFSDTPGTRSSGVPCDAMFPVLLSPELTVRKPISALGCKPKATGELPCRVASMWSKICPSTTGETSLAHTRGRAQSERGYVQRRNNGVGSVNGHCGVSLSNSHSAASSPRLLSVMESSEAFISDG